MVDLDQVENYNAEKADIGKVTSYVDEYESLEVQIQELEDNLKAKKERLRLLEEQDIPQAMDECQLKTFTSLSGAGVKIQKIVKASLPTKSAIDKAKDDRKDELIHRHETAMDWLKSNDGESLIKNKLEAEFGKGQDNVAGDFYAQLLELGIPVKKDSTVHPATLSKFVEEKITKGIDVPKETLGVFIGRKAKISKPKPAKS